ncbi:PQQ-dependent sugar dehydrogenase [Phenylobacterium sp.]|uniref:PQQ-dependent sugar dehydrogenase n=1 Tax=Phenylobacterium sp. TaxID=1871053 RepID=UPI002736E52F|nr:PQQ-dependent sugar dehydrogenase [Phenylobacterium sp.]MDP3660020.1 PQQ-dependent sugar dehydrogenase [Phenylobacterium sp.]
MPRIVAVAATAALLAACGAPSGEAQPRSPQASASVESRPPNAARQSPAFAGQTRAPRAVSGVAFRTVTVAEGLEHPWGMAFLPDGRLLVSERPGRLRIVGVDGALSAPIAGLPAVDARDQGGLLGLTVDPAFADNSLVYWSFAERGADGLTNTAVARGKLITGSSGAYRLEGVQVIFRQKPSMDSTKHYGGRLVFGRDGMLFVTLGERSIVAGRMQAQRMDGLLGKVARIRPDGTVPPDNPFVGKPGVRPEIFSLGHRNIQAAAINPRTGELWEVEHGARGGDEVNVVRAGRDYGWPTITYGEDYSGQPIGQGITAKAGMEQPVYYWDPVIAPSGMTFYEGDLFPAWKGSLFVGGLAGQHLVRLTLDGDRVSGEERLLVELGERIRDVVQGPDGALYVATDADKGRILKLVPGA